MPTLGLTFVDIKHNLAITQRLIRRFSRFTSDYKLIKHTVLNRDAFVLLDDLSGILIHQSHHILGQAFQPQKCRGFFCFCFNLFIQTDV